jgi:hypothetical protein
MEASQDETIMPTSLARLRCADGQGISFGVCLSFGCAWLFQCWLKMSLADPLVVLGM